MRLIAAILTCGALALAALSGLELWHILSRPAQQDTALDPSATDGAKLQPPRHQPPRHWPALFGEPQPPKPTQPPQQTEPQPPQPPKPPIESLGYQLRGRVQVGSGTWAILAHPSGEQLLRKGDELREGIIVVRIDEEGLWVSRNGDQAELLGFEE